DGAGGFLPLSILQSGIYIPGNGKALVKLQGSSGKYLVAASQNKDVLKLYELKRKTNSLRIEPDEVSALIRLKDGKMQKEEFYYGTSFLSQSARFLNLDSNMVNIKITNSKGKIRTVNLP
ncbi:MAG TPA: hypothetical protein VGM24_05185, partial [Puia sp.]